jgi:hypothetical protein
MKVLLIIGGVLVVLAVVVGVAGYIVVRKYGPGLMAAAEKSVNEGREYGRQTDNEGCVNEAASRHAHVKGFGEMVKNGVFMRACLEASRPTPGFCDGVPGRLEFMKSADWQLDRCKRYGLTPQQQCGQLFQQVQQFCEQRGFRGGGGADAPPAPAR